jgi:hypothetical protein
LEGGPLSDTKFPEFAKSVVLFLHNTSRVEDEKYPTLLQDKGFRGFPSICFMDAEGNVLTKPGRSVQAFVDTHQETMSLAALRGKKARTAAEDKQLFLAELKLDLIAAEQIQARADKLTLDAAEKAMVAGKLVDAEVQALFGKMRETGPEKTAAAAAEMAKAGKVPTAAVSGMFWNQVLVHASKQKDAALAQQAFDALQKRYADEKSPGIERQKQNWQKLLDEAKAK